MIDIEDLEFTYPTGDFRLQIGRFHVDSGEKLALTGPSGSGKTTLLSLVAGIATPASGVVHIGGKPISTLPDAARRAFRITRIGFVFQNFELIEYLSVLDNILHPYRISNALTLDTEVRERASDLATRLGINDKLTRSVDDLSQGERQRVAICRAMLTQPALILADEPTGNLDPATKRRILDVLLSSQQTLGATLITVTHDHDLLPSFDRVIDFDDFARQTV